MNWEDIFEALLKGLEIPGTLDEAIKFLEKDEASQLAIENMAFKQVVLNILIAAHITTENDFNASVEYFKKLFTQQFAEELLKGITEAKTDSKERILKVINNDNQGEEIDSDWDADDTLPKA